MGHCILAKYSKYDSDGCYEKLVALLIFTESGEESDREESTYSLRSLCNEC